MLCCAATAFNTSQTSQKRWEKCGVENKLHTWVNFECADRCVFDRLRFGNNMDTWTTKTRIIFQNEIQWKLDTCLNKSTTKRRLKPNYRVNRKLCVQNIPHMPHTFDKYGVRFVPVYIICVAHAHCTCVCVFQSVALENFEVSPPSRFMAAWRPAYGASCRTGPHVWCGANTQFIAPALHFLRVARAWPDKFEKEKV